MTSISAPFVAWPVWRGREAYFVGRPCSLILESSRKTGAISGSSFFVSFPMVIWKKKSRNVVEWQKYLSFFSSCCLSIVWIYKLERNLLWTTIVLFSMLCCEGLIWSTRVFTNVGKFWTRCAQTLSSIFKKKNRTPSPSLSTLFSISSFIHGPLILLMSIRIYENNKHVL